MEEAEMTDRTFDSKVAKMMELNEQMKAIEKQMDALKEDITNEMTLRDVDVISTKKYSASWSVIVSNRFDSTAFKKSFADLYKQFTKVSEARRFTFKSVA